MVKPTSNILLFIILLIIFDISKSSIIATRWVELSLVVFLLLLFIVYGKQFDKKVLYLFFVWVIINVFSMIFFGSQLIVPRIVRIFLTLLFLPYLVLKNFGISFWFKFERVIFSLTVISLPLYVLNIIFPEFFSSLQPIFKYLTRNAFYVADSNSPYWSSIIYVNAIKIGSIFRNCGFMWEAGSFAMIIVWAIIFNWLTLGAKFDKRFFIYLTALITTFSTAGYFALFFILVA